MQGFQKQSFVLAARTCFKNISVIGMYIVAGFQLCLTARSKISTGSGLVLGSPRFSISLALSYILKLPCPPGHFVHSAFQFQFCRPLFWLLENISQCLHWLESCLDILAAQNASNALRHSFHLSNWFDEALGITLSFLKNISNTSFLVLSLRSCRWNASSSVHKSLNDSSLALRRAVCMEV